MKWEYWYRICARVVSSWFERHQSCVSDRPQMYYDHSFMGGVDSKHPGDWRLTNMINKQLCQASCPRYGTYADGCQTNLKRETQEERFAAPTKQNEKTNKQTNQTDISSRGPPFLDSSSRSTISRSRLPINVTFSDSDFTFPSSTQTHRHTLSLTHNFEP